MSTNLKRAYESGRSRVAQLGAQKKPDPKAEQGPKIPDEERRRADNQIWNAAGAYDFIPDFRTYDRNGRAELYWNSIIGAARKHYGHDLDLLWEKVRDAVAGDVAEQLAWMGVENACFQREAAGRPAFPLLRRAYALKMLDGGITLPEPYAEVYRMHFEKAAGLRDENQEELNMRDIQDPRVMLRRLECTGDMSGEEVCHQLIDFLREKTLLIGQTEWEADETKRFKIPFLKKKKKAKADPQQGVRDFGSGLAERGNSLGGGVNDSGKHTISDMSAQESEEQIARFIRDLSGTPLLSEGEVEKMDRAVCTDDHEGCHLWFAKGDGVLAEDIQGYAGQLRRQAIAQMARNRSYREKKRETTRVAINKLTEKWRNAFLTYRQDTAVRSDYGLLRPSRIWRLEAVEDTHFFDRITPAENGDFGVDILIDASLSQEERQSRVALQAYIIAESLTRCHIPVRVSSFCTMSGHTIVTQYRDYHENDKNDQILNFTTVGGNRDGLAIRIMRYLAEHSKEHPEHRILLLLSDARPNDAIHIRDGGRMLPYNGTVSVENTAREVRRLQKLGVAVLCVYTGLDEDLPAAHKIYNRDFVRIRSLDDFAQAVGNLMLTQIQG